MEQAKIGRPSSYSSSLAEAICARLADGESLRKICAAESMPDRVTVFRWLAKDDDFRSQYAAAREAAADLYAEEIIDIADRATNKEDAPAIKVRIDARMWVASKLRPRVYGSIAAVQLTGANGGPIATVSAIIPADLTGLSEDELTKLYRSATDPSSGA